LLVVGTGLILVLDQVVVQIEVEILLWNLILHDHGVGNSVNNGGCLSLEEVNVLGLVQASVPCVLRNILAALDNEYRLFCLHVKI
jgi:hypothetical protein